MMPANYLSLVVLLVAVVGLACGRSSHSGGWESGENNNMKVESSFKLSMPLFMRNAIDVITSAMPSYPTTTQRPCGALACQNGGSLRPRTNGSCPTCECLTGYHGSQCESYSGSITSRNCSAFSCYNGGTVSYGYNGSCWCNCHREYLGDYCEYINRCEYDHGYDGLCLNGAKRVYDPLLGSCVCACPPCYNGTRCENFTSNCDPADPSNNIIREKPGCDALTCYSHELVVFTNGSCSCDCQDTQTGDYCEILNSCILERSGSEGVNCRNGGQPYYDPEARVCKCACLPGYLGSRCNIS